MDLIIILYDLLNNVPFALLQLEGIVPHSTGCARTEGYYRLSHKEKRGVLRRPDVFLTEINEKVSHEIPASVILC